MKQVLTELFYSVAPNYDPAAMLDHLFKTFPDIPSNKLEIMIAEFVKFMFLQSKINKGFIPLIGAADEVWHAFILQTREYEKFCLALPGACFLHHASIHLDAFAKATDKKAVVQELLAWLPNYVTHFGEFTPEAAEYWFMIGFLREEFKFSLEDINRLALSNTPNNSH